MTTIYMTIIALILLATGVWWRARFVPRTAKIDRRTHFHRNRR